MDRSSVAGYTGARPDAFRIVGETFGSEEFEVILEPGSDLTKPVEAALQRMKNVLAYIYLVMTPGLSPPVRTLGCGLDAAQRA